MQRQIKKKIFQLGNLVVPVLVTILSTIYSVNRGSNIKDTFSPDEYEKLLGPAGISFAIWGLIFLFLGVFVLYQARDLFKSKAEQLDMPYVFQVNGAFMVSIAAASAWYVFWAERAIYLSFFSMMSMLISILFAYFKLNINRTARPLREHFTITIPWSLYAGWVTAAVLVSLTTVMIEIGFASVGITEPFWTIFILLVALATYSFFLLKRNDYIYASVGIWVLLGVIIERLSSATLYPNIVIVATLGIIILVAEMIYFRFINDEKVFPNA